MIIPKFNMRKKTRSILTGLLVAVTSLIALAVGYEEARANMLSFFIGCLLLLGGIAVIAVCVVAAWVGVRKLLGLVLGKSGDED
ncbi:MAG: hypothetical protein V4751_12805 [Pseudomonadota bacterium]